MRTYTVHEPPLDRDEDRRGPERFVFVRDGFHFWAFLLAPVWMLWRGLVLALLGYLAVLAAVHAALYFGNVPLRTAVMVDVLLAVLVGLEAASLRRWTLRRHGWGDTGIVSAPNHQAAERRFFEDWTPDPTFPEDGGEPTSGSTYAGGNRRDNDVIGLFPEPGAVR